MHVHDGGQIQHHQSIHRLVRGIDDVNQALVGADLVLITRILVDVRRGQDGETLLLGRQRDGATDLRTRALGRLHDLFSRAVDQAMIEGLQADANFLFCHVDYFTIFVTTPAPAVRPPSRLAQRRPSSMAMGLIRLATMRMLSPGMTISTPSGSSHEPVTSVVRK